jgi:hypothetical protein
MDNLEHKRLTWEREIETKTNFIYQECESGFPLDVDSIWAE